MHKLHVELRFDIDVQEVVAIAEVAAQAILRVYHAENPEVEIKADQSPLTRADREANSIICSGLTQLAPHIPIVSEENQKVEYSTRKNYQYCWCVDPLDGTKEFLKRNGQFTVNIALLQGAKPVLGVVHVPVQGKVYWAVAGKGAWARESPASPPRQLHCATFRETDPGLVIVGSASHASQETAEFVGEFRAPQFRAVGSSLKLLMVAEGAAHMYPRLAPTCEWDTAAAHAIVEEAGGRVLQAGRCDSSGNALEGWRGALEQAIPLHYNKPEALNPFFVVYGKELPS
ncbi:hypothetical protein ACKKBG_A30950 [Auxenochlorella protothecoides x Auxenochlorella symbiontica]|uniref:3'(2'),5'-bisphosphate nucleotidase 1 n=1 Tax=Auxenochlorella protothecoides TaxID=3075 RepID=A0A1D2A1K9_AUXPR